MNITVIPGKATEDVKQIEEIVASIERAMAELDQVIGKVIPEQVETEWSNSFKDAWKTYYDGSVKNAMEGMKLSAVNLQNAVDAALEYNKG